MRDDQVFKQVGGCLLEAMDQDSLLFNPHTTTTLHLNPSSALVWELCDGERCVAEIIGLLQQQFPQQSAVIPADVKAALDELLLQNVVVEVR